jgi:type I restriction enzyme R subunit
MTPITEADTCRKYVLPKLYAAGWDDDRISEQKTFTDGRIVVAGNRTMRRPQKRSDYLLRYRPDFSIAVVEAKAAYKNSGDGLQQAKEYAQILGLKFAYATNGHGIVEHDFTTGHDNDLNEFPSPEALWERLKNADNIPSQITEHLLTPYYHLSGKSPRYYQEVAINRAVQAILQGKPRILLTLATGTGKTVVAFQICWKLWSTRWNRTGEPQRRPRILYLADRNILVDDPKDKIFAPFGDARHKIEGEALKSREMYFATYQAIAKDERRPGLYREYPKDFFDLIVVDECHRGSARDESNWRDILDYFSPAFPIPLFFRTGLLIRAQDCGVRVADVRNEEKAIPVFDHEPADGRTSRAAGRDHRYSAVHIDAVICRNRLVGRDAGGCTVGTPVCVSGRRRESV